MLLIGLTGSIATGKSTVSTLLSKPPHSLPVIDADLVAREVVLPGRQAYKQIVAHFQPTTPDLLVPVSETMPELGPDGNGRPLDRPALGRRVFGNSEDRAGDRKVLNGIVHPAVRRAIYAAIAKHYITGSWAVVLDVPLLFESGLDMLCGVVAVVGVKDQEVQLARLMARDPHLSRDDAENRVNSQGAVGQKAARALERGQGKGVVVWNDGTKEELHKEVDAIMEKLTRENPRWWHLLLLACPPLAAIVAAYRGVENWAIDKRWKQKGERARL